MAKLDMHECSFNGHYQIQPESAFWGEGCMVLRASIGRSEGRKCGTTTYCCPLVYQHLVATWMTCVNLFPEVSVKLSPCEDILQQMGNPHVIGCSRCVCCSISGGAHPLAIQGENTAAKRKACPDWSSALLILVQNCCNEFI